MHSSKPADGFCLFCLTPGWHIVMHKLGLIAETTHRCGRCSNEICQPRSRYIASKIALEQCYNTFAVISANTLMHQRHSQTQRGHSPGHKKPMHKFTTSSDNLRMSSKHSPAMQSGDCCQDISATACKSGMWFRLERACATLATQSASHRLRLVAHPTCFARKVHHTHHNMCVADAATDCISLAPFVKKSLGWCWTVLATAAAW